MYETYFGFREKPFSIAPDPRFVYLSPAHEEALAHLVYGVNEGGGFVLLTGEVGTGKTTLVRTLLEQLPEHVDVALIFNPRLSPLELVASICDELGVAHEGAGDSLKSLVDLLNRHLLEAYSQGRRTVLLVDEAQALTPDVLEQIRLLTNLETTREKLLEIILVGQPELRNTLARTDLRQLAQRITARYHLDPLDRTEVGHYVHYRLGIVGGDPGVLTRGAVAVLAKSSGGIPRLINEIADRALLGAYAGEHRQVTWRLARRAAGQVLDRARRSRSRWHLPLAYAAGVLALAAVAVAVLTGLGVRVPGAGTLVRFLDGGEAVPPIVVTIEAPDSLSAQATAPQAWETDVRVPEDSAMEALRIEPTLDSLTPGDLPGLRGTDGADELTDGATFSVWLDQEADRLSRDKAFSELLALWNIAPDAPVQATDESCGLPAETGIRCLSAKGDWNSLLELNRPAVLRLAVDGGKSTYVAVSGLTRRDILLRADGREYVFPRWAVRIHWSGDFIMIWKMPAPLESGLQPGDRSEDAVAWLRQRLAEALQRDIAPEGSPAVFDDRLVAAVRAFQQTRGLPDDGRLDGLTLLQLFAASPLQSGPRLWRDS